MTDEIQKRYQKIPKYIILFLGDKMVKSKYIMAIDAGTSKIKVVLFDIQGNEKFSCCKKNIINIYNNFYEQDMKVLWKVVSSAIKELIEKNNIDSSSILSIGITGQGEGCWLVDKYYNPVRNAILWCDGRSGDLVIDVNNKSKKNQIIKITGSVLFPGSTTAIVKWLKINEPESLLKAKYILFCKDWLRYKLTGQVYMDFTDSSTSLLNKRRYICSCWNDGHFCCCCRAGCNKFRRLLYINWYYNM